MITEINELRQTEDVLTDEKERIAVALRLISDGVIITDIEGRIVSINETAEAIAGWTEEEAIGRHLSEVLYIVDDKTRMHCEDPFKRVLDTGGIVDLDAHAIFMSRDGTERIIADRVAPFYNRNGGIAGFVLVFRDVTESRRIEEGFLKVQEFESISILAGRIAHDFNNVLTAILGNISLAKMNIDQGGKVFERLTEAEKVFTQAKDLTQRLTTFSKFGAPVLETGSLSELLRDSINFILSGTNVKCEFSIPGDLWPAEINYGHLGRIINNVVINAKQAMPEGGIVKVSAENITLGPEGFLPLRSGKYVKISIRDYGVGIPEENLQRIFDPYFTTKQKGSGLGLAISRSIVKNYAGHISVESREGLGTTFFIYLPAASSL